jgi:tRNA(adenine34) deaminase
MRETAKLATAHAEIIALENACRRSAAGGFSAARFYVTSSPADVRGAIINSRIDRVVFGAYDPKAGCLAVCLTSPIILFTPQFEITGVGVAARNARQLLGDFFRKMRIKKGQASENDDI